MAPRNYENRGSQPFKLSDPLILARHTLLKTLDLSVHPQKNLNDHLTASVIDRLRLNTLHKTHFDTTKLSPPTH